MFHRFRSTLLRPGVDLRPTHSDRLARWLGAGAVEKLSRDMRGWYGPPIAVHGVPGGVFVTGDGDFIGTIEAGVEASALDRARDIINRERRRRLARGGIVAHQHGGFASLSDLIAEATSGKQYQYIYQKTGPTGVANVTSSLYRLGAMPVAGAAPANPAGGTAFTDASTGGYPFTNPTNPDTQHIVSGRGIASVVGNSLLLYDLIFGVNKTMNSTTNESVTGVPTRYQGSVGGAANFAGGNFLFIQVGGTALAATAHNWTGLYRDNDGTDAQTLPTVTGNSAAIVDRLDQPSNTWFCPLASGDVGIMDLNEIDCSALVATGVIWWMIGHPIAWMGFPIANLVTEMDYVQTAFNLTRIFDDAFLTMLEVNKPTTTATTYNVHFSAVAG